MASHRSRVLPLLFFLPLLSTPTSAATVAHVGMLLPLEGASCEVGTQYWHAMDYALRQLHQQTWWPAGLVLNATAVHAPDPYSGWRNALAFMSRTPTPVAMLGPTSSDAMVHAAYVAAHSGVPIVDFSATASELTLATANNPAGGVFRVCHNDLTAAAALWHAMDDLGWRRFGIVYVRNEFGRTFFEALEEYNDRQSSSLKLSHELTFSPGSADDVNEILRLLRRGTSRVVVLACTAEDARFVMQLAAQQGMTGKGWVWLGEGWVHTNTWRLAGSSSEQHYIANAMSGAIGVLPDDGALATYANGALSHFVYDGSVGNPVLCPELATGSASSLPGLPAAPYVAYAFDAMWAVGVAVAGAFDLCGNDDDGASNGAAGAQCLTGAAIAQQLRHGGEALEHPSPITGDIRFLASGDRDIVSMDLVNAHGTTPLRRVGTWTNHGAEPGQDIRHTLQTGSWLDGFDDITWPGGQQEVPSDRVRRSTSTDAWFFFLVLTGLAAALLISNVLHRRGVTAVPESGVAVLLGVAFGLAIRAAGDAELTEIAEFGEWIFGAQSVLLM